MHIDILNLLRTAHTFSAMYVNIHTVHTVQTYILCVCVCVCECVLIPWFLKTLHSVERDFLWVNPRFSTWHQSAQLVSRDVKTERMLSSHKLSAADFSFSLYKAVRPAVADQFLSQLSLLCSSRTRQVDQGGFIPRFQSTQRGTPL